MQLEQTRKLIRDALLEVNHPPKHEDTETRRKELLALFEKLECWVPYFKLAARHLADPGSRTVQEYAKVAKNYCYAVDDVKSAADLLARSLEDFSLDYRRFRIELLSLVLRQEDFAVEALILEVLMTKLKSKLDRIDCLERLCLLYEKKIHNDQMLAETYERLLQADPKNIKALRYFKLMFTQNQEWENVVAVLKTLLMSVRHPQEMFRTAHELAGVYLYQLDQPKDALQVIRQHCQDSPLDSSTINYDAYQRLGDLDGCLQVLRECLLGVGDDQARAILHHRMAMLLDQVGQIDNAKENYRRANQLSPSFLDPLESLIAIAVEQKDWATLAEILSLMSERVCDHELQAQLKHALKRLQNGMETAGN